MTTSFGLLFYLKKGRKTAEEEWPIYLRITVDGIPKEISIQRVCLNSKWNAGTGRAIGLKDEIRALNSFLNTIQSKVFEAKHKLIESVPPGDLKVGISIPYNFALCSNVARAEHDLDFFPVMR